MVIQQPQLDTRILQAFDRISPNAILVEGFIEQDYESTVQRFSRHIAGNGISTVQNFLEMLKKNPLDAIAELSKMKKLFLFNMDLFGDGVNPYVATNVMTRLGGLYEGTPHQSQLMFARPNANMDYNSRSEFSFCSNHPLGNWCEFYVIQDGRLVQQHEPIRRR